MANHKSAFKRARQNISRNKTNKIISSQLKNKINEFNRLLIDKKTDLLQESLSSINSSLSKALKKGLIKKNHVSRKLSLLSNQIKKIT